MPEIYVISLAVAVLSVLPIIILVLRNSFVPNSKASLCVIHITNGCDIKVKENDIRQLWWDEHFHSDVKARDIVVLLVDENKKAKEMCYKLLKEFQGLIILDVDGFIEYIRNEAINEFTEINNPQR